MRNIYLIILLIITFWSCNKKLDSIRISHDYSDYHNSSLLFNKTISKDITNRFILEGIYLDGCSGRNRNSIWKIYSKAQQHTQSLVLRKNDDKCQIAIKKIVLAGPSSKPLRYSLNGNKNEYFILTNEFQDHFLEFKIKNKSSVLKVKESNEFNSVLYVKARLKKDSSNYADIEIVIKNINKKYGYSDSERNISLDLNSTGNNYITGKLFGNEYVEIEAKNSGNHDIKIDDISYRNIVKNNCIKMHSILKVGDSCKFFLRLTPRTLDFKKFKFSVRYSQNDNSSIKNISNIEYFVRGKYSEKLKKYLAIKFSSIGKIYPFGESMYITMRNEKEGGVYYSSRFPVESFYKIKSIPSHNIKSMEFSGGVILATADDPLDGGLYYSYQKKDNRFYKINKFTLKNPTIVKASGKYIYVGTATNGLYFSKNGHDGSFEQIKELNEHNIKSMQIFKNKIYVIANNSLYFSKNLTSGKFYKSHFNSMNMTLTEVSCFGEYVFVVSENGLYYSKNGPEGVFENVLDMNNMKISTLYSYGNELFLGVRSCHANRCKNDLGGIYVSNMNSELKFQKIYDLPYISGLTISNNILYASSDIGLYYSNDFYKKIKNYSNEDTKNMDFFVDDNKNLYLLSKSRDEGYLIDDTTQLSRYEISKNKFDFDSFNKDEIDSKNRYILDNDVIYYFQSEELKSEFKLKKLYGDKYNKLFYNDQFVYISSSQNILVFNKKLKLLRKIDFKNLNDIKFLGGYAILASKDGVYFSSIKLNTKIIQLGVFKDEYVYSLAILGNSLYANTKNGVVKTHILDYPNFFKLKNDKNTTYAVKKSKYLDGGMGDDFINQVKVINGKVFALTQSGLAVSKDWGKSFRQVQLGTAKFKQILESDGLVYAATSRGLYYSKNYGKTFEIYPIADLQSNVNCIEEHDGEIFVAKDKMLFKLNPSLNELTPLNVFDPKHTIVSKMYSYKNSLYIITESGSLFILKRKNNFYDLSPFLPFSEVFVTSICIEKSHFYIGTKNGLYVSTDKGMHFKFLNMKGNGLISNHIMSVSTIQNNVFVGTDNGFSFSFDNGETFTNLHKSDDFFRGKVYNIEIIPKFSNFLTLSTFLSTDQGVALSVQ